MGIWQGALEGLELMRAVDTAFWRGRRVLLTGHSGLKGSWLTLWLHRLGAEVTGISLPPATTPSLFRKANVDAFCQSLFCDIRDAPALIGLIQSARPEIVFHLAAQSLVRASYKEPRATFDTNVMGTVNVLDALRGLGSVRVAVMITTDKVYRDHAMRRPYREDDPLGGHDPYSGSKAACEIAIASYRSSFLAGQGVVVASARAGNVIGGGDWSEDRLIPDAIRAWQAGATLAVRQPMAVRPWQYLLEPLAAYLILAESLWRRATLAGAYNFGPDASSRVTVRELVDMARAAYGSGEVCCEDGAAGPHEADWLALDTAKAQGTLGIRPTLTLAQAVGRTVAWYRAQHEGADALTLCQSDIAAYEALR